MFRQMISNSHFNNLFFNISTTGCCSSSSKLNCSLTWQRAWTWTYGLCTFGRKFRSQTSDNMDRWKAQVGRVREGKRREEKRREEKRKRREEERRGEERRGKKIREEKKVRRKKMQAREKGREVANHSVFAMICGSGGSQSRLDKAAGAEASGQIGMKSYTPLWNEARFDVKMYKTPHVPMTFGILRGPKSARCFCAKHILNSKCIPQRRSTFGSWVVEKGHPDVAQSSFPSENAKNKARDFAPSQKWARHEGFVACLKPMAGMGHLKKTCEGAFRVAGAVHEAC